MAKKQRIITKAGYVLYYCPNHPVANRMGYIYEHRHIVEQRIGRFLRNNEQIHHIDFNKSNNDIGNLMLCESSKEHKKFHSGIHPLHEGKLATGENSPLYKKVGDVKRTCEFEIHIIKKRTRFFSSKDAGLPT